MHSYANEPSRFVPGQPKWWQWPTILSLDAPCVVVAWQWIFGRCVWVSLAAHHVVLLFTSVWMAYAADRWIEGWRLPPHAVRTQRHYFAIRWRRGLLALWIVVLLMSVGTAVRILSRAEWLASLALMSLAVIYLLSHQFLHRNSRLRVPKEICVSGILTGGAGLYPALWAGEGGRALMPVAAAFFALALANCLLITRWERDVDAAHGHLSSIWRRAWEPVTTAGAIVTAAAIGIWLSTTGQASLRGAGLCAVASALFLAVLAVLEPRLGRERARVLVDCALMTPLVAFLLS